MFKKIIEWIKSLFGKEEKVEPKPKIVDGYTQYERLFLVCQAPLLTVAYYKVEEEKEHMIVFQAQTVNDSASHGKETNVMIAAKLFINGVKIKGWTENVDRMRHYCNPTLVKKVLLKVGDVVEIKMRADSSQIYPVNSVFVLLDEDRFQFEVN
jgi:hypothetical protein